MKQPFVIPNASLSFFNAKRGPDSPDNHCYSSEILYMGVGMTDFIISMGLEHCSDCVVPNLKPVT